MLAVNQENEKLMEEYEKLASEVRLEPEPLPTVLLTLSPLTSNPNLWHGLQSSFQGLSALAAPPSPARLQTKTPGHSRCTCCSYIH